MQGPRRKVDVEGALVRFGCGAFAGAFLGMGAFLRGRMGDVGTWAGLVTFMVLVGGAWALFGYSGPEDR